ncbi:MAG: DUF3794 domain-containing protein [Eubacteriales bacterium]
MELQFTTNTSEYLKEIFCDTISQEETGEVLVPDSYPDVERMLDCSATVVLRSKDSQQVSGAILATALYAPEDFGTPKALEYYIPFRIKCQGAAGGTVVDCHVQSADARMLGPRKVLVRVRLAGTVKGYDKEQEERYTYDPQPGEDLELMTNTYTILRPVELSEKTFTISEELELSPGGVAMEKVIHHHVCPQITEAKMMGGKGVFKGHLAGKILYEAQESLYTWEFEVPFSQYVDVLGDYDQEELQVTPMLTEVQLDGLGNGGCLLHAQLLTQCAVLGKHQMEVVEDAYSLGHQFLPQWKVLTPTSRLNQQTFTQVGRYMAPCPAKTMVYTQCWLGEPEVFQRNQRREIIVPVYGSLLYEDVQGQHQCHNAKFEVKFETEMWEDCICHPTATLSGAPVALVAGDEVELRCPLTLQVEIWSETQMQTLCGGELTEPLDKKTYPSVILRPVGEGDTLWSLAKGCRTTARAIQQANQMGEQEQIQSKMLLIPIVK